MLNPSNLGIFLAPFLRLTKTKLIDRGVKIQRVAQTARRLWWMVQASRALGVMRSLFVALRRGSRVGLQTRSNCADDIEGQNNTTVRRPN